MVYTLLAYEWHANNLKKHWHMILLPYSLFILGVVLRELLGRLLVELIESLFYIYI